MAAIRAIDEVASHASWMEGFPWTRVARVEAPGGHKAAVDLAGREDMTPQEFRERLGDGSFGGYYQRPDDVLLGVWRSAVDETRTLMDAGWDS
jgi:creatinine amidohydrolase